MPPSAGTPARARAPSIAETSRVVAVFTRSIDREGASASAIVEASEALTEALARGARTTPSEAQRCAEAIARAVRDVSRSGAVCVSMFVAFEALSATYGGGKRLDACAAAVAERACGKVEGDDNEHVARAFEALRLFINVRGFTDSTRASLMPALKFARKLLDTETLGEEPVQAALLLAAAHITSERIDGIDEAWRKKARRVLDDSPISIRTLIGPQAAYMSRTDTKAAARRILKSISRVTLDTELSEIRERSTAEEETSVLDESTTRSSSPSPEASTNERLEDVTFAMRRHFDCALAERLAPGTGVHDMFSYQIDVMCAYAKDFCETIAAATKWVRACRRVLRKSMMLRQNATSNRTLEHALRMTLDANVSALTSLSRLAKMVGARKIILASNSMSFITAKNIDAWVRVGFDLVKVAAREHRGLAALSVVALATHEPQLHIHTGASKPLSVRLAFVLWSRMVHARRADAKGTLFALLHYENTLQKKAFQALRDFAPYHRKQAQALVLKFGLRWRKNAHEIHERAGQSFAQDFDADVPPMERVSSPTLTPMGSRPSLTPWSPARIGPGSSRAKTLKTSTTSKGGSRVSFEDAVELISVPQLVFTEEQTTLYDIFQAWAEYTYEQRFVGTSLVALKHRNQSLMRKCLSALRRHVVRSVAFREKLVVVENATLRLEFLVCAGAAFRKWLAGVRYIKRLYAFVDGEVERWREELRMDCFRAWREIAASGARMTLWEEQMLADVTPSLEKFRRQMWFQRWIMAQQAFLEERFAVARSHRAKAILRAWRLHAGELVVRRLVSTAIERLSLLDVSGPPTVD